MGHLSHLYLPFVLIFHLYSNEHKITEYPTQMVILVCALVVHNIVRLLSVSYIAVHMYLSTFKNMQLLQCYH